MFGYDCSHHGNKIGLRELRRRHPRSLKGASLSQVMDIARRMGFMCRPLRLDLEHLKELQLPCIPHWDLNHFVVLKCVRKRDVIVFDPLLGKRVLPLAEFSRHFTGVALEPSPGADLRPSAPPAHDHAVDWQGYRPVARVGFDLDSVDGAAGLRASGPSFMQWIVDHVLIAIF